eukprot:scaffold14672_cov126-Skeletonema_marinoi.AAC.2
MKSKQSAKYRERSFLRGAHIVATDVSTLHHTRQQATPEPIDTTMKIIAGTISLLLPATNAFSPQLATAGRSSFRPIFSTALSSSSYLDNLSSVSTSSSFTATDEQATEILDSTFRRTVSSTANTPSSVPVMSKLSLNEADILANGVIDNVNRNEFPPIVVTVVDRQANILVQKRMDDVCHAAFPEFSYAKAFTCVTMGVSSRDFRDKYTATNDAAKIGQMNSMMAISKMAAFPGGVLLRNGDNEIIGAVG